MNNILKSMRLHIGIFGKSNVGKSSLLNMFTSQNTSIVSDIPGTTTDVVEKSMELLPIGPVVFLDTAGIDDITKLGEERILKTFSAINRVDVAIIVCDYSGISNFELNLINEFNKRKIPFMIVINKNDIEQIDNKNLSKIKSITDKILCINTKSDKYINQLKELILKLMPSTFFDDEKILDDIIEAGDIIVNVIPIDKQAPKGRLILPQVRTIRNILDNGAISIVTSVEELENVLKTLNKKPKLVITDSQAFDIVSKLISDDIYMTSYSILFARLKGDLNLFVQGAKKIEELKDGDKILVCESCTHHASCDDIGRVKIPNLLSKKTGKKFEFVHFNGHDFPENLNGYSLIIHCGGCMTNKKEILARCLIASEQQIPITNYGIVIAYCLDILDFAIKPILDFF